MRRLLLWHAAEEIEHKAVAFDVLCAGQSATPCGWRAGRGLDDPGTFWFSGTCLLLWQESRLRGFARVREDPRRMRQLRKERAGAAS